MTGTGTPDTAWYDGGSGPFDIANPDELAGLAELVNAGNNFSGKTITLIANLDMSKYGAGKTFNGGKGWVPIGIGYSFKGIFDGNGKTIKELSINNAGSDALGLFGTIDSGSSVHNLTLKDISITGRSFIGGVAEQNGGTVEGCSVSGNVEGSEYVGGIAGMNSGTITACSVSADVEGKYVGGITARNGSNGDSAMVRNCYVSGSITVTAGNGGGIAGESYGGTVEYCYSTGSVTVYTGIASGIMATFGNSNVTVQHCVALNSAITGNSSYIKRIVGWYSAGGTMTNNYGNVAVMTLDGSPYTPVDNADDQDGADVASGAGGYNGQGFWEALGFDFTTVWKMSGDANSLPVFK